MRSTAESDEADTVFEGGMIRDRQILGTSCLRVAGAAHHVLAGDDVERGSGCRHRSGPAAPLARVLAILSRMLGPTAVVTRSAAMMRAITSWPGGTDRRHVAHHVQLLIRAHHVHLVLLAVV